MRCVFTLGSANGYAHQPRLCDPSDTKSLIDKMNRVPTHRRRLRLQWRESPSHSAAQDPLDSHQQRLSESGKPCEESGVGERQVEAAAESIRRLASRVVFKIPRAIRRQHWSALNVPLLWAAAEDDRRCPMIVRLMEVTQTVPNVVVAGVPMAGPDAVMAGWDALRNSMRRMGIGFREQFAEWIHKPFPCFAELPTCCARQVQTSSSMCA